MDKIEDEFWKSVRLFLAELDDCKTTRERELKVAELIHGIARGARLNLERQTDRKEG